MGVRAARRRSGSKSPAAGDGVRARQPRAAGARAAADVPAILQAIARTAARLCEATDAQIHRVEGDQLRLVAIHGSLPIGALARPGDPDHPKPAERLAPSSIGGRSTCVTSRRPPPAADIPGSATSPRDTAPCWSSRSCGTDRAVGLFIIQRTRVQPFTAKQIALLRTFADQAAIALENERPARGARGTEPRADRRARARDRDGRDPADHLEVADRRAAGPRGHRGERDQAVRRVDRLDGSLRRAPVDAAGALQCLDGGARGRQPRVPDGPHPGTAAGRAILERRIIHIHDVRQDSEYTATPVQQRHPRLSHRAGRAAPPRGRTHRGPGHVAARRQALLPEADRPDDDLRRPGRHRHRERPPVHGAGGAEPRPDRGARAADGHERDPAGHLQLADRCPAGLRHDREERRTPV